MAIVSIETLEKQVAQDTIEMAQRSLGLNTVEVAAALGVDRRTVLRYCKKTSSPSPRTRAKFAQIREIDHLLNEVFVDKEAKLKWLYSPVPMLRGRQPIDLIRQGDLDQVVSILSGILSGASA